jgi:hypothetical protein
VRDFGCGRSAAIVISVFSIWQLSVCMRGASIH